MIDVRKLLIDSFGHDQDSPEHKAILADGLSAVPALIEALRDPALQADDAPGEGWAPVHAADLLGDLRAADAVEPLLAAYQARDWTDHLKDSALQALQKIGAPSLEPALRAFGEAREEPWREALRELLSGLGHEGVQDDRAFQILCHPHTEGPSVWAARLANYGDERAVPLLLAELDRRKRLDPLDELADPEFTQIAESIGELGGKLQPQHQKRIERTRELERDARAKQHSKSVHAGKPAPAVRTDNPGRNDPCWCGSTKKYKKCHLAADESGR